MSSVTSRTEHPTVETTRQGRALGWLAVGAVLAIAWLAHPVAFGMLLGALLAFTLEPVYNVLVRRTGRPFAASLATVVATAVVIVGLLAGFVSLFITRAIAFANNVREALGPGGALTAQIDTVSGWLGRFGISPASITSRLAAAAERIASRLGAMAGSLASGTFGVLLGLFFALLTMHVVLRHWQRMVSAVAAVAPLDAKDTRALLNEFRRVGRLTLSGTVVTGVAQGVLAGLGFWMTGVPQPTFFGIATALASLVPAVGTLLVWIPAGLFLLATGHTGRAISELIWGALIVVGLSDYAIRPHLVGGETMPVLLVFIALFGGLEVFGLAGLIAGPVVVSLAVAVLRLYAGEEKARRTAKSNPSHG
jgi:predicted PurR-regulated permease PerM